MYWNQKALCINLDKNSDALYQLKTDSEDKMRFHWFSNQRNQFKVGMPVLALKHSFKRGYSFEYSGKIVEYNLIKYNPEINQEQFIEFFKEDEFAPSKRILHEFVVSASKLKGIDDDDFTLEAFKYSLPFVTDYRNPIRHFGAIKFIKFEDYQNIIDNNIYITRTVFGELLNALPEVNRRDIIDFLQRIEWNSYLNKATYNYRKALEVLISFIKEGIYIRGALILKSHDLAKGLSIQSFQVDKIGFGSHEDTEKGLGVHDNLSNQKNRIAALFAYDEKNQFWQLVNKSIEQKNESESIYARRFSEIYWPLIAE